MFLTNGFIVATPFIRDTRWLINAKVGLRLEFPGAILGGLLTEPTKHCASNIITYWAGPFNERYEVPC